MILCIYPKIILSRQNIRHNTIKHNKAVDIRNTRHPGRCPSGCIFPKFKHNRTFRHKPALVINNKQKSVKIRTSILDITYAAMYIKHLTQSQVTHNRLIKKTKPQKSHSQNRTYPDYGHLAMRQIPAPVKTDTERQKHPEKHN